MREGVSGLFAGFRTTGIVGGVSEVLIDLFNSTRNQRPRVGADRIGHTGKPGRGRFFIIYFGIRDQIVARAQPDSGAARTAAAA